MRSYDHGLFLWKIVPRWSSFCLSISFLSLLLVKTGFVPIFAFSLWKTSTLHNCHFFSVKKLCFGFPKWRGKKKSTSNSCFWLGDSTKLFLKLYIDTITSTSSALPFFQYFYFHFKSAIFSLLLMGYIIWKLTFLLSVIVLSTFGGNPLASAVAIASLDVIRNEGLAERYQLPFCLMMHHWGDMIKLDNNSYAVT